jgi:hypothetical protein
VSAQTCCLGITAAFRQVEGLRGVLLGEPTGDMDLPCLYIAYASFDRPLRNTPPARNLTGMRHLFVARLVIQWVDFQQAEQQLIALLDRIPQALDDDGHLSGLLDRGMAYCDAGVTGFAGIGGVLYRIVDYQITVLEKIAAA